MSQSRTTLENENGILGLTFSPQPVSLANAIYGQLETETLALEVFGHSEAGRSQKRSANQDYFYLPVEQAEAMTTGSFLFAVADGVGGADHSERASEIAVKQILKDYYAFARHDVNHQAALTQAAQKAHLVVREEERLRGHTMATTFVAALLPAQVRHGKQLAVDFACIGDSRAYVLRAGTGQMEQITRDSLWYNDEQARGGKSASQADALVKANPRLMQSPRTVGGIAPDLQVDFFSGVKINPNDIVLLCTDGLYKPLGEVDGIQPILQRNTHDLNQAATILLNTVRRRGRLDDTTLVMIRLRRLGSQEAAQPVALPVTAAPVQSVAPAVAGAKTKGGLLAALAVLVVALLAIWGLSGKSASPGVPAAPPPTDISPAAAAAGVAAAPTANANLSAYPTNTPAPTATPTPAPTEPPPTATPVPAEPSPTPAPAEAAPATAPGAEPTATPLPPLPTVPVSANGDCAPGQCKYPNPPAQGHPVAGSVYDSPDPFEFAWGYVSLGPDEYFDIRIYDSPAAAAPVKTLAVRDRNLVRVPLQLDCRDYYWSIRISSAAGFQPDAGVPGLFNIENYTGGRSPESGKSPFTWKVGCAAPTVAP